MNKEKQIEEMAKYCCNACDFGNQIDLENNIISCAIDNEYKTCPLALETATLIYTAGYRKQEWISVEDRLPESGVNCLLCCDVKRYDGTHKQYICDGFHAERFKEECHFADDECVVEYNEETDEYYLHEGWYENINNWDDYSSIAIDDTVTHWMPLPEVPKMKGDSDAR